MSNLLMDVREEFQIPPYFPDSGLENYLKEGAARLSGLNPTASLNSDPVYNSLLKNYVYYAYHHKLNEWEQNYASVILSWQMGTEVDV